MTYIFGPKLCMASNAKIFTTLKNIHRYYVGKFYSQFYRQMFQVRTESLLHPQVKEDYQRGVMN